VTKPPILLALRALGMGDLLVAVPALRGLAREFPDHRRLLATSSWLHPLLPMIGGWLPVAMPDLAACWPSDLPSVEVAVNLHGNGAASAALLDATGPVRRIGHLGHGWAGPEWVDEINERRRWCRLLAGHGIAADEADLRLRRPGGCSSTPGAALVHPGAAYGAKRWPARRFAAVAGTLRAEGHRVLVTGSAGEHHLARRVAAAAGLSADAVLAGRTGLPDLAALVARAALVVSGDTGIAHLATAFGTPSVTLFGPVDADRWGPPPGGPHRALQVRAARRGDPFAADPDPALLEITVRDVLAAAAEVAGRPAADLERLGR
jgi:ADP-heptose:LPS heptosyltransferase